MIATIFGFILSVLASFCTSLGLFVQNHKDVDALQTVVPYGKQLVIWGILLKTITDGLITMCLQSVLLSLSVLFSTVLGVVFLGNNINLTSFASSISILGGMAIAFSYGDVIDISYSESDIFDLLFEVDSVIVTVLIIASTVVIEFTLGIYTIGTEYKLIWSCLKCSFISSYFGLFLKAVVEILFNIYHDGFYDFKLAGI